MTELDPQNVRWRSRIQHDIQRDYRRNPGSLIVVAAKLEYMVHLIPGHDREIADALVQELLHQLDRVTWREAWLAEQVDTLMELCAANGIDTTATMAPFRGPKGDG